MEYQHPTPRLNMFNLFLVTRSTFLLTSIIMKYTEDVGSDIVSAIT